MVGEKRAHGAYEDGLNRRFCPLLTRDERPVITEIDGAPRALRGNRRAGVIKRAADIGIAIADRFAQSDARDPLLSRLKRMRNPACLPRLRLRRHSPKYQNLRQYS